MVYRPILVGDLRAKSLFGGPWRPHDDPEDTTSLHRQMYHSIGVRGLKVKLLLNTQSIETKDTFHRRLKTHFLSII